VTHADLRYAALSDAQTLDLVVPTGAGPFPLIIKIHGGAFLGGDKASEFEDVDQLNAAGYAVASINYRLSCEAVFPAAVQDVKAAVRFLRAHAADHRLDPHRFAAWGESAGANLAAMIGVTGSLTTALDDASLGWPQVSSEVQAVVGWYGPYDFTTMDGDFAAGRPASCADVQVHDSPDSPESRYLGAPLPSVRELAATAGPGHYLASAPRVPPFLLVTGDGDCLVPYQQSSAFHQALLRAGAASTYTVLPGAVHADPAFRQTQTRPALRFLDRVLGR
jgi:acetyl esterase/lipase